jgi:ubiquinone/menaquinone biosynthesis C-methylase UbiE
MKNNIDLKVIEGFSDEWSRFDQSHLLDSDRIAIFKSYFSIFPWHCIRKDSIGIDIGCGTGRWAELVAPRIGTLHCVDASSAALSIAKRNLITHENCIFHLANVNDMPLEDGTADFAYSLGVLHHVPDTRDAIKSCVAKLKEGAPFLIYLYYAFDNRAWWFRAIWQITRLGRLIISRLPPALRYLLSQAIAMTLYLPLARFALLLEKLGANVEQMPLSFYRRRSFYVMRTDALDRFGTRLEKRFTKKQIHEMMHDAGLQDLRFSESPPYWVAVGLKSTDGTYKKVS